jgi:hypothetical protein
MWKESNKLLIQVCFRTEVTPYLEFNPWKDLRRGSKPTNNPTQSPNGEEKDTDPHSDDEAPAPSPPVLPKKKIRMGAKKRVLESSDDDDDQAKAPSLPVQPRKKVRLGTQKKRHDSSNDAAVNNHSEDVQKTPTRQLKKSESQQNVNGDSDSELEIIEKPQESAEQELGMWINKTIKKQLKKHLLTQNDFLQHGIRQFMPFLSHVPNFPS